MKVILVANTDWFLYNFCSTLAKALRDQGNDVILASPSGPYAVRLIDAGFQWVCLPFPRFGVNPLSELLTLVRWVRFYHAERPDVVHHFTIKCVLYGSIAARLVRTTSVVNSVTGLGYVFVGNGWRERLLRRIVMPLYRISLVGTHVIFENEDDQRKFRESGLVRKKGSRLIRSSGVEVRDFVPSTRKRDRGITKVLFASRFLRAKGMWEFVEAARVLRKRYQEVSFCAAGDVDPGNPDGVPSAAIEQWRQEGVIQFLGQRDDMKWLLQQVSIVVLASYREGVPRILLEAAACGLPLVATDVPGCRDVVRHGENGILVPIKDVPALVDAIETLLRDDELRLRMGEKSREIACAEFDIDRVIQQTFQVYAAAGADVSGPGNIDRAAKVG